MLLFILSSKKRVFISSVIAFFLVLAGASLWYVNHKKTTPPPASTFALHQKIAADAVLHLSFPRLLNHESTVQSMVTPQGITGEWRWEEETLLFDPAEPLAAGETYTFTLPPETLTAEGDSFGRLLEFIFTVRGPPVVSALIPGKDAKGISPLSRITMIFDRPMVPLTQVQGEGTDTRLRNWPVTIDPPLLGRWRWISTMAIEFIPTSGLVPATRYTVSVPAGIKSVSEDLTRESFLWSFETVRPALISSEPAEGSDQAGPTTAIQLQFNQEVTLESARAALHLMKQNGNERTEVPIGEIRYGKVESKDGAQREDRTRVALVPAAPLDFLSAYLLIIGEGIRAVGGGALGLENPPELRFRTVGPLTVKGMSYQPMSELTIELSSPVTFLSAREAFRISPEHEGWEALFPVDPENDAGTSRFSFYPWFPPSTTFTITVAPSLTDVFGQKLKEPFSYSFTTPPLSPEVFIDSKGEFGIFERGKPPIYYLNALNVSELKVEFAKLPLRDFLGLRTRMRSTGMIEPKSLRKYQNFREWTLNPEGAKDHWKIVPFDLAEKVGSSLTPGIYVLSVHSPEYRSWDNQEAVVAQYFAITDTALTLKYSGNKALVWAVDMQTGAPVAGAKISFHTLEGKTLLSGQTDAEGFYETPFSIKDFATLSNDWDPEFYVTAEAAGDFAFVGSAWNEGIRPWDFNLTGDTRSTQSKDIRVDSYVYTERPLYRAGDTVLFKGIVRFRDWEGTSSLPDATRKVLVKVEDAEANVLYQETLPLSGFGSFSGSLPIDRKASLGAYILTATVIPDLDIEWHSISTIFSVLDYRKPEYKVELTTPSEDYFDDQTVETLIAGSYYFGAPMGNAGVAWRAQTTDYFFNRYTDGWYSFALEDAWCYQECERKTELIAQGSGKLDAAGRMTVKLPVDISSKPVSQILTIEADIIDENNQVVSNRISVPVHKADIYVGVRTEDYMVVSGEEAEIGVIAVKTDGTPAANREVKVELFHRTWNTIRKKNVDGEYYYENEPKDTFQREVTETTGESGKATMKIKVDGGGEFRAVATVLDAHGRESKSGTSVYAWSETYFNWPHTNTDRIEVLADKREYKVGDTAKLLVKSPFQGPNVKALVTVERENVLRREVITVTSNAQAIHIPITEDLIPNAFVSVVIIKPREGEVFDDGGRDTGIPAYRIGYVRLPVEISSKSLTVEIKPSKEKYLPGEEVHAVLTAKDATGNPVKAEISLGVVDMSVLALSSFERPDLLRSFYGDRGLGVTTSQMLKYMIERYKPGSKGGGGADLEAKKRGTFKDTAFFSPAIVTNEKGEAEIRFTLPDNLTTWHFLAIAHTKDHLFGAGEKRVIATKQVIIRPVRPRFVVIGDEVTLGAIVHNFLPALQTFRVSLSGSGFTTQAALVQEVTLKSDEQQKILFPISVGRNQNLTLTFAAEGRGGARDEVEERIPIFAYGVPQTVATAGLTEDIAVEKVFLPHPEDAEEVSLRALASATVAAYLPKGLDYLLTFPYGCAEQTVSSFLPSVVLSRLQGAGAVQDLPKEKLQNIVTSGLERLYTFQRSDGGFGFWQESDESNAPLSAYILFALEETKEAGMTVDGEVMSRVRQYLHDVLRSKKEKESLDLATRAAILFSLSETGEVDVQLLENLSDRRTQLPLFARAQLAMAFMNEGGASSRKKAEQQLREILDFAKVSARGTHFEEQDGDAYLSFMNTNDRTTAFVLQAMLRIDPTHTLIPSVIRSLLDSRRDGHWSTTQATVQVLLTLIEYLEKSGELDASYTATFRANGEEIDTWKVSKETLLSLTELSVKLDDLKRGEANEMTFDKDGQGNLYYDLLLSYILTDGVLPAAEEGIAIQKNVQPVVGSPSAPTVGGTYRVTLTITVPDDRYYVAVESPLPAGFEPIDLSLATSQQTLLRALSSDTAEPDWWSEDYWRNSVSRFGHREYRDDRVFLFAENLPAGVYQYHYLMRATTPGMFHVRPTRAWQMYAPESFGQTSGEMVQVKE